MRIVQFYKKDSGKISFKASNNPTQNENLLHIETEFCVVNIRIGLEMNGTKLTTISVLPDKTDENIKCLSATNFIKIAKLKS